MVFPKVVQGSQSANGTSA